MPKLPDDLGARPVPQIAGLPSGRLNRGAAAPDLANADLGQTISNIGFQMQEKTDKLNFARAKSSFLQEQMKTLSDLDQDQDFSTYERKYTDRMKAAREASLGLLGNSRDQQAFELESDTDILRGLEQVKQKAWAGEKDSAIASVEQLSTDNRESAIRSADQATRFGFIKATQDAIDGLAEKGYISKANAVQLRQKTAQDYAEGIINSLPYDQQIKLLQSQNPAMLEEVYAQYPGLRKYNFQFKDSKAKPGETRHLEFYFPGESHSTFNDKSRPGIERFDPNMGKMDILGDMLHYIPTADKEVGKLRNEFQSSITEDQKRNMLYPDYQAQIRDGLFGDKKPSFDEWLQKNGGDAFFRGYLANQYPKDAYTKEQVALFGRLDSALRKTDGTPHAGSIADFIPSDKRQNLLDGALREKRAEEDRQRILADRERALFREDLSFRIQDASAAYLSGQNFPDAPTQADFRRAYDDNTSARRWQSFKTLQDASADIRNLYAASPAERQAILAKNQPVAGDGFAEKEKIHSLLMQTNNRITQLQNSDPAAYVAQFNPSIAQSYQEAISSGDKGAIAKYAMQSLAEQRRLGIAEPMILPKAASAEIAQSFFNQQEGGQNAAKLMDALEEQWGPAFPKVYEQLAKENKLPPSALVIPNMSDKGSQERLARWSLVDDKVFEDRLPDKNQTIKAIRNEIATQTSPFWNSLAVQNGGENTFNTYASQLYKLSLGYAASGKTPSDAVEQAYQETIGHAYDFGPSFRVPKTESPSDVMLGAQYLTNHPDQLGAASFPSASGLTAEQAKRATHDVIRNNPVWVTNSDETGLTLYAQGNNGLNLVRKTNGQPITMTWEELRNAATNVDDAYQYPYKADGSSNYRYPYTDKSSGTYNYPYEGNPE